MHRLSSRLTMDTGNICTCTSALCTCTSDRCFTTMEFAHRYHPSLSYIFFSNYSARCSITGLWWGYRSGPTPDCSKFKSHMANATRRSGRRGGKGVGGYSNIYHLADQRAGTRMSSDIHSQSLPYARFKPSEYLKALNVPPPHPRPGLVYSLLLTGRPSLRCTMYIDFWETILYRSSSATALITGTFTHRRLKSHLNYIIHPPPPQITYYTKKKTKKHTHTFLALLDCVSRAIAVAWASVVRRRRRP